jgi:hypothetical protein
MGTRPRPRQTAAAAAGGDSIPASLQTLGRGECVAASAPAPHGLRIISLLTSYLNFLGAIWTFDKKKLALSFPPIHPPSRPRAC